MSMVRTYSELIKLPTFKERFEYLKLGGVVGEETFGFERYLNQTFYRSPLWRKEIRNKIIFRDNGCDLGLDDYEIAGMIIIHHLNPITVDDIRRMTPLVTDPENLICVSKNTHDAIHYGDEQSLFCVLNERTPNDTCPWKE